MDRLFPSYPLHKKCHLLENKAGLLSNKGWLLEKKKREIIVAEMFLL